MQQGLFCAMRRLAKPKLLTEALARRSLYLHGITNGFKLFTYFKLHYTFSHIPPSMSIECVDDN